MTTTGHAAVVKTGVDIQTISRFREQSDAVARGVRERVFTGAEREYCENAAHPAQHYAARWAAKEAFIKLIPAECSVRFRDVTVDKDESKPVYSLGAEPRAHLCETVNVTDPEQLSLDLSLSHDRDSDVAVAQAVVSARGAPDSTGEFSA